MHKQRPQASRGVCLPLVPNLCRGRQYHFSDLSTRCTSCVPGCKFVALTDCYKNEYNNNEYTMDFEYTMDYEYTMDLGRMCPNAADVPSVVRPIVQLLLLLCYALPAALSQELEFSIWDELSDVWMRWEGEGTMAVERVDGAALAQQLLTNNVIQVKGGKWTMKIKVRAGTDD